MGWTQNGLLSKWLSPLVTLTSRRGKQYWNMISSFVSGLWRQWMWKIIKLHQDNKSASAQPCIHRILYWTRRDSISPCQNTSIRLLKVDSCDYLYILFKTYMTKLCWWSRWQSLAWINLQRCKLHSEILLS